MARTKYTVTFPAAKAGDEVTWPNSVKVYPDANAVQPLGNGYIESAGGSFSGWSDTASVTFTRAGTSDAVTVTSGSPTGTGAAVPGSAASGAGLPTNYKTVSGVGTDTAGDYVAADTTSAGFTRTLPTGPTKGQLVAYEKSDTGANVLTVAAPGGGTISYRGTTDTTAAISSASTWIFEADGVGANTWRVVATNAGSNGTNGTNGTNGNTVLNGSGAPASGTGVNGDFYIDTTAHAIYGPKAAGAWGGSTSLVGPAGTSGSPIPLFGASIGQWQAGNNGGPPSPAGATHAFATGLMVVSFPFIPQVDITIDQLRVFIGTGGSAGSVVRLGIYQVSSASDPYSYVLNSAYATLLHDSGTIASTTSSANVTDTLGTPQVVTKGTPIVFAFVGQVAAPTLFCENYSGMGGTPYGTLGPANGLISGLSVASVTAALPATFTPTATVTQYGCGINFHRSA